MLQHNATYWLYENVLAKEISRFFFATLSIRILWCIAVENGSLHRIVSEDKINEAHIRLREIVTCSNSRILQGMVYST